MADWNLPLLSSTYADFLNLLRARDEDSGTMGTNAITNPLVGHMRYVRADNKFQEWNGSAWIDKVLSIAGGGTGANSALGIRTNIGLGTMAVQNANNVTITGGTISGLSSFSVAGAINAGGAITAGNNINSGQDIIAARHLISGSTPTILTNELGRIPDISANYFSNLSGANLTSLPAGQLTGTLPAISGVNLTNLNGSAITVGTVAAARLGSGVANATTYLAGDNTWKTIIMPTPTVYVIDFTQAVDSGGNPAPPYTHAIGGTVTPNKSYYVEGYMSHNFQIVINPTTVTIILPPGFGGGGGVLPTTAKVYGWLVSWG